jgi:hypothetical protein
MVADYAQAWPESVAPVFLFGDSQGPMLTHHFQWIFQVLVFEVFFSYPPVSGVSSKSLIPLNFYRFSR